MRFALRATAGLLAGLSLSAFAATEVGITIDTAKPGPVINKNIYGQFAEHLGSGIYGGLWVGPDSKIPNTRGWRNDVVGALKDLQVPFVRWPGGCFADEYHWREGIGPRSERPVKVNTNWGGVEEDNAVGTHEFFDLVDLMGTQAYVNGNLGTGTPQEMADWIEYMTANGKSTLAQLRAKNGHPAPFKVAFFAIGNEAWGCGGNMSPQYYNSLYNQYSTFLKAPKENRPLLIASGGQDLQTEWTEALAGNRHLANSAWGISHHYYTLPTGNWQKKGAAVGFNEDEWMSTLVATRKMDEIIKANKAKLDEKDPKKKLALAVDEWGTWFDPAPGTNPGFLVQQNTLRDAVVTGLNFNIFHDHADRVRMTAIAQMVNVLQAMVLTDKEKMLLTPTYHVFKMYVPFQDATSLPASLANNPQYSLGKHSIPALSVSAAKGKDGKTYVALVNSDPKNGIDAVLNGKSAKGSVLTAAEMDAHNSFAAPAAVKPQPIAGVVEGGKLKVKLPAKSVVVVAVE